MNEPKKHLFSKGFIVITLFLIMIGAVVISVIGQFPDGIPMKKYERKIIYGGTENKWQLVILWAHCTVQGGKFNTCGSPCAPYDFGLCLGDCVTTCDAM